MSAATEHVKANREKWDRRAGTYDRKRFDYFRFFQWRVIAQMHLKEGQCFLDIGCGTGWAVRRAAGLVGGSDRACGIDISPAMIEKAQAGSNGDKSACFLVADAAALPFEQDFFDFVMCTNSFHHYLDPAGVLAEIRRVLRPGGKAYVMDPTADLFIVKWADRRLWSQEPEHVKLYSTPEFRGLFEAAGLKYAGSRTILPVMKVHVGEK
jgi:ubiquinone/menaquinone biosynthesis C-methylase UbiE